MFSDSITETIDRLRDKTLLEEEVQRLFDEWWPKRIDAEPKSNGDQIILTVESIDNSILDAPPRVQTGELSFPRQWLSEEQLAKLTSTEEVQRLFDKWWPKQKGQLKISGDRVSFQAEVAWGGLLATRNQTNVRVFPLGKLSKAQLEKLAMSYVMWGAGRAAAIALVPLPLADVGPLMANEAYMIHRIAEVYGYTVDKSVVAMLAGVAGGSLAGKFFASFLPFLKVAIAPSVTYAVGKAAMAYFASGMTLAEDALKQTADAAGQEARKMDWDELKVENPEEPEIPESPE